MKYIVTGSVIVATGVALFSGVSRMFANYRIMNRPEGK